MGRKKGIPSMLYDLYKGEELLGKYSAGEIAEIACCGKNAVYNAVKTGGLLSGLYHVDYGLPPNFKMTWTAACGRAKEALAERRRENESGDIGSYGGACPGGGGNRIPAVPDRT